MMKSASALAGLVLLSAISVVQASELDVSYTVSGSTGSWVYDFSLTNNLGGTNDIYFFGVELEARNIAGSPANWDPNAQSSWNTFIYSGGKGINYDNIWVDGNFPTSLLPGQTLSGFAVASTELTPRSSVRWFAFSANPVNGGTYTGTFCTMNCGAPFTNPGFEYAALQAVPVPAAFWFFGSALGFMGVIRRKLSS